MAPAVRGVCVGGPPNSPPFSVEGTASFGLGVVLLLLLRYCPSFTFSAKNPYRSRFLSEKEKNASDRNSLRLPRGGNCLVCRSSVRW